jgi:hypothetical protein
VEGRKQGDAELPRTEASDSLNLKSRLPCERRPSSSCHVVRLDRSISGVENGGINDRRGLRGFDTKVMVFLSEQVIGMKS